MLVGDLLQLYTRNAPVALSLEFTHEYEFFDQAGKVPKHLRDKEVRHIDGQSMREDHGITIWYKLPDEKCVVYATVRDDGSDTTLDYIASALTPAPSYQEIDDAVYQEIGKHIADFPDDDRLENYIPHHVLKKLNIIDSMVHH